MQTEKKRKLTMYQDPNYDKDNLSEDSYESTAKDELLHEFAEKLRRTYKQDPKKAICKSVIYNQHQTEFKTR